jgi:hypothetical protein
MENEIDIKKVSEYREYVKYKSEIEASKIELEKSKNEFANSLKNTFKKELREHFEQEKNPDSKIKKFFKKIFKR